MNSTVIHYLEKFMVFSGAQFHMLVNHLPVIGFLGMVLALVVAVKVRSMDFMRFVLLATIVVGLSALAPYLTGEPAEEVIEHLPSVSKDLIYDREELAEKATAILVITAVAGGVVFFLQRRRPETLSKSIPVVLLLSLITAVAMGAAARESGKIRHPEINPTARASGGASDGTSNDKD